MRFELYTHRCTVSIAHVLLTATHTQSFDDVQYSEVRKGPIYTPKSRSTGNTSSPPPPKTEEAGISELDNLLAMLSDTQKSIQAGKLTIFSLTYFCKNEHC